MKKLSLLFLSFLFMGLISTQTLFGQNINDFRSRQSGDWGFSSTWEQWNGSAWVATNQTPNNAFPNSVIITGATTVAISSSMSVRNVTVNIFGILTVSGDPTKLTITNEGMTVNGTLIIFGDVPTASPFTVTLTSPAVLTIGATGVVNYDQTGNATGDKGALPTATWLTGSTLNVNSTGGTGASGWNSGGAQNFYNVNWNCPLQTANFGWGFGQNTVGGTFSVLSTNTGRLQFFGGSSGTLNVMGDLIVSGSAQATINGTSTGSTFDTINVYGKVNVNTTGNFSVSRGSQGGTGKSIFNFYGDSVKIIAGAMSNSTTLADGAKFIFKKNGTQFLTLTPTAVSGNALPVEVDTGSTVALLTPVNVTTLYLNGGLISSTTANPLIMGWWTGSSLTSGTVSPTAPGSLTSYVGGPMAFLVAAASSTSKTYPIGKGGIYRPITLGLTQSAATLSTYTAEMVNAAPTSNSLPVTLDKVSTVRYYKIAETAGGSAFTAGSVLLNYSNDDLVPDPLTLRIAQGPAGGGEWVDLGGAGSFSPTGNITSGVAFTDLTTDTIFTLANNAGGGNLPVELTSFISAVKGSSVILRWSTATEVDNHGFNIERSSNKSEWTNLSFVNGSGNSNSVRNYSYSDNSISNTGKYYYRLKQIDNDGIFKLSNIIEVNFIAPDVYSLNQNYPNPFNPSTIIAYSIPKASNVKLLVYNAIGQTVKVLENGFKEAGIYNISFNASELPSGLYFYKIEAGQFSQIKKMMLLK